MRIIYPDYICIVEKTPDEWRIKQPQKLFWRSPDSAVPVYREKREEAYGLTTKDLILPLFKQYLGKLGFYIVNMRDHLRWHAKRDQRSWHCRDHLRWHAKRDREYYYCGLTWQDVREKLWEIGITKPGGK